MMKSTLLAMGIMVATLYFSCAPSISREGSYGQVTIDFAGASVRALATGWPNDTIPSFSTVTVKVSAVDMDTVTLTASASAGSVRLQVPAGNDRLIEVTAIPASGGGAPTFAKTYSGSATADLKAGEQTAVPITLSPGETKILLPSFQGNGGSLKYADSLSGPVSESVILDNMTDATDFEPDAYGRIFISGYGLSNYTNLTDAPVQMSESQTTDLAYDASQKRLYAMYDQEGVDIRYYDVATSETTPVYIDAPSGYDFMYAAYGAGVAADGGFLYTTVMSQDLYYLGKFSVPAGGSSVVADLKVAVTLDSLGISSDLTIRDMIVKDGVLYIAAAVHGNPNGTTYPNYLNYMKSRGKVVAVSTANLTKLWEVGMSDTPVPTSPATEFYGPVRFVGLAPRKLYVADEGYSWEDTASYYDQVTDVNRVVEINLDTGEIEAIGLNGEATFFENFSGYYAVGINYSA